MYPNSNLDLTVNMASTLTGQSLIFAEIDLDLKGGLFRSKALIGRGLGLLGMLIVILYVRVKLIGSHKQGFQWYDNPLAFEKSLTTKILSQLHLYGYNFKLLLFPATLCCDYTVNAIPHVVSIFDSRNLLSAAFLSTVAHLIRVAFRATTSHHHRHAILVSLSLIIIPFLPASNLFFPVGFVLAERVLYIPSMGLTLLVAMGLDQLQISPRKKDWILVIRVIIFFLFIMGSVRTMTRNLDWRSEATFIHIYFKRNQFPTLNPYFKP